MIMYLNIWSYFFFNLVIFNYLIIFARKVCIRIRLVYVAVTQMADA